MSDSLSIAFSLIFSQFATENTKIEECAKLSISSTKQRKKQEKIFNKTEYIDEFINICESIHSGNAQHGIQFYDETLFQAVTLENLLTQNECQFIISEAEQYARMLKHINKLQIPKKTLFSI